MNSDALLTEATVNLEKYFADLGLLKHINRLYIERKGAVQLYGRPSDKQFWLEMLPLLVPPHQRRLVFPGTARISAMEKEISHYSYHSSETLRNILRIQFMGMLDEEDKSFAEAAIVQFQSLLQQLHHDWPTFVKAPEILLRQLNLKNSRMEWLFAKVLSSTGFNIIGEEWVAGLFSMLAGVPELSERNRWLHFLKAHFKIKHRMSEENAESAALRFDFMSSFFYSEEQRPSGAPLHPLAEALEKKEREQWHAAKTRILTEARDLSIDELLGFVAHYIPGSSYERLRSSNPAAFENPQFHAVKFFNNLIPDVKDDELVAFIKSLSLLTGKFSDISSNSKASDEKGDSQDAQPGSSDENTDDPTKHPDLAPDQNDTFGVKDSEKFSQPEKVYNYLKKRLAGIDYEVCIAMFLNTQNQLLHDMEIAVGTINRVIIDTRQIYSPALRLRCAGLIIAHNHPAGNAKPSDLDDIVTEKLSRTGEIVGIPLLDHIIIGKDGFYSYRRERRLS